MNIDYLVGLATIPAIVAATWCLWAVWEYALRPNPWRCRICDQRKIHPPSYLAAMAVVRSVKQE